MRNKIVDALKSPVPVVALLVLMAVIVYQDRKLDAVQLQVTQLRTEIGIASTAGGLRGVEYGTPMAQRMELAEMAVYRLEQLQQRSAAKVDKLDVCVDSLHDWKVRTTKTISTLSEGVLIALEEQKPSLRKPVMAKRPHYPEGSRSNIDTRVITVGGRKPDDFMTRNYDFIRKHEAEIFDLPRD